jgi:hypothetical protein
MNTKKPKLIAKSFGSLFMENIVGFKRLWFFMLLKLYTLFFTVPATQCFAQCFQAFVACFSVSVLPYCFLFAL